MYFRFKELLAGIIASAVVILGLSVASPSIAALIEVDLIIGGDGFLTRDTDTQLDWLDVNLTANTSYNHIVNGEVTFSTLLGSNPKNLGFRHATAAEALILYENAGVPDIDTSFTFQNFDSVTNLMSLLGPTYIYPAGPNTTVGSKGLLFDKSGFWHSVAHLETCPVNVCGEKGIAQVATGVRNENQFGPTYGHFLVRDASEYVSPVPIPAALPLFLSGLLGLGVMARRRQRHAAS